MKLGQPFKPMDPVLTKEIFDGAGWAYQVKWDGVRMISHVSNGTVRLFNKRLNERTRQYPEMAGIITNAIGKVDAVLDGEMIAMRGGKPNFYDVIRRDWAGNEINIKALVNSVPVYYMLFDIVYHQGEDLRVLPLTERQQRLKDVVTTAQQLVLTDTIYDAGTALFEAVTQQQLEGVVAKDTNSKYITGGKNKQWLKIKVLKQLECVVGGYTLSSGQLAALVLGLYRQDKLLYIGRVNASFSSEEKKRLRNFLHQTQSTNCAFVQQPKIKAANIHWVKPQLVVLVQFLEWTDDLVLRHPSIVGFSSKQPEECRVDRQ